MGGKRAPGSHKAWRDRNKGHLRRYWRQYRLRLSSTKKRRQETEDAYHFIQSLKEVPCQDCEKDYPPWCMEFDHVRGKKVANIATLRSRSIEFILNEVAKCDIVCANCHRTRTYFRRQLVTCRGKVFTHEEKQQRYPVLDGREA